MEKEKSKFAKVKLDREITTHKDVQSEKRQIDLHKSAELTKRNNLLRYKDFCINLKYVRTIEKINTSYEDIICFHFSNGDYLDWKFNLPEENNKENAEEENLCPKERDLVFDKIMEEFTEIII